MTRNDTTRRGFLGSLGAVAALPLFPSLATHPAPSGSWTDAVGTHVESFRAAFLAELARFAETLRPQFEAGELRAYRDGDYEKIEAPQRKLERLCEAHFGLEVTERRKKDGGAWIDGDTTRARLILAVSPRADATGEGSDVHPCDHAREAVAWDVIAVARERGWYTSTDDEDPDPLAEVGETRGQS
jgi:hypothetical protein